MNLSGRTLKNFFRGSAGFAGAAALVVSLASAPSARADLPGSESGAGSVSAALVLGACVFNQGLGTEPLIGAHLDYRFLHWLGAGLFIDYTSLGNAVPGMPGVAALNNGSFYIAALELNLFPPGFLRGLSIGPAYGFSTYNSPQTTIQGSFNSTYATYGVHVGYDVPISGGLSVGALVTDMYIVSNSDLGFNVNEFNLGAVLKFGF